MHLTDSFHLFLLMPYLLQEIIKKIHFPRVSFTVEKVKFTQNCFHGIFVFTVESLKPLAAGNKVDIESLESEEDLEVRE